VCVCVLTALLFGTSNAYGQSTTGGKTTPDSTVVPELIRADIVAPSAPILRNSDGVVAYSERIAWLREQLMKIDGFGGLWVSWASNVPTIEITAVHANLGKLRKSAISLEAVPEDWTRYSGVKNSYSDLAALVGDISAGGEIVPGQFGVGESQNTAFLRVRPKDEDAIRKRIKQKSHDRKLVDGDLTLDISENAAPTPAVGRPASQQNSTDAAGTYLCTLGFAVLNGSNQPGFVTAGHCSNLSGTLNLNGATTADTFGSVVSEALGGAYELDRQFHLMTGSGTVDNRLPGQTQQVSGTAQPYVGMPIAKSGRWDVGGVVNTTIDAVDQRTCYPAGAVLPAYCVSATFTAANTQVRSGDSGGPIWLQGTTFAVGIVDGCSRPANTAETSCDPPQNNNIRNLIGVGLERSLVGSGFRLRLNAPDNSDGLYSPLTSPVRLSDGFYSSGSVVSVSGGGNVPSSATGLVLNVTVDQPIAAGHLIIYPAGQPLPSTTFLNYSPTTNAITSNQTVALRGQNGNINIYVLTQARVIVDLVGYFSPSGFKMNFQAPARVFDSRSTSAFAPNETRTVVVDPIFSNTLAVWGNVTVTGGPAAGFVTVYPSDNAQPLTSSVNWTAGQTVANNAIVRLSSSGRVNIFNGSSQSVHVILDVFAKFPYSGGTQRLVLSFPERVFDSRIGSPVLGGSDTIIGTVRPRTPPGKSGLFANVVIIPTAATGNYLTAYTYGNPLPAVSNVNSSGAVRANGFIAEVNQSACCSERIAVRNGVPGHDPTHFLVDVLGYFVSN
jgi:hypothetical protein